LLAIFPILALTLMMGGVNGAQFWKTCLALVNALFCSLAAGVFVSALSRDSQKALAATVLLLLALTLGGPLLDAIAAHLLKRSFEPFLTLSSPGYTFRSATFWGHSPYWTTLAITQFIAWMLFVAASLLVPRTWQERASRTAVASQTIAYAWKYGRARARVKLRRKLIERDAVLWLACRERWQSVWVWMVALFCAGGFVYLVVKLAAQTWMGWQYVAWMFLMFFYLWAASQACRFFVEARRSGLIELLLATPVSEKQIVRGQWRALVRMFGVPLLLLLMVCMAGAGLSQRAWHRISSSMSAAATSATAAAATNSNTSTSRVVVTRSTAFNIGVTGTTNSAAQLAASKQLAAALASAPYVAITVVAAVTGGLTVAANFIALFWFGMWMGMTSKNANTATAKTLLFVHVVPWMMITFASGMSGSLVLMMGVFKNGGSPSFQYMAWYPLIMLGVAGILTLAKDIVFFIWARKKLYGCFRAQAAQSVGTPRSGVPPTILPAVPAPPIISSGAPTTV
jgi:ABC-type transport system involved in multi-copper enzyme maturation permease subunit